MKVAAFNIAEAQSEFKLSLAQVCSVGTHAHLQLQQHQTYSTLIMLIIQQITPNPNILYIEMSNSWLQEK